jgi:hypothetical protein
MKNSFLPLRASSVWYIEFPVPAADAPRRSIMERAAHSCGRPVSSM